MDLGTTWTTTYHDTVTSYINYSFAFAYVQSLYVNSFFGIDSLPKSEQTTRKCQLAVEMSVVDSILPISTISCALENKWKGLNNKYNGTYCYPAYNHDLSF